ncbi:hypothetical protein F2Q69_00013498 [Brassica cretica]|uniref:Uncharacterized protein n=1 Tax=Brassica cretica TaxID=69181 RepID=A0A8S9R6U4_BRACR|nr:hypothetical protein F2Q69_00013498 [Brassica cretica]
MSRRLALLAGVPSSVGPRELFYQGPGGLGPGSCREAGGNDTGVFFPNIECTGYSLSSIAKSSNKGQTVGEKYLGIEFFQTRGRTPASRSPLRGTPVPRYGVLWVRFRDRLPSSGKRKTSDKENLPYFQIRKSLTYIKGT